MNRRTNQLWNTKWADVQINHGIRNEQRYKSNTGYEMDRVQINYGIQNGRTYKSTTEYKMGRRTNQPQDTKWADVQIKSTAGYKMGKRTNQPR